MPKAHSHIWLESLKAAYSKVTKPVSADTIMDFSIIDEELAALTELEKATLEQLKPLSAKFPENETQRKEATQVNISGSIHKKTNISVKNSNSDVHSKTSRGEDASTCFFTKRRKTKA